MVLVNHAFSRNYFYSRFNTDSPTFKFPFGDGSRKDSTGAASGIADTISIYSKVQNAHWYENQK